MKNRTIKKTVMKNRKIKYSDVISLGFKEEFHSDKVYFNEYGFDYTIVTLYLTKKIFIDWAKETQECKIVRIDSPKTCNIMNEKPIKDLKQLKEIISFFTETKNCNFNQNILNIFA